MCRRHIVYFTACAHQDPIYNKTFPCSDYTRCGPIKVWPEYEGRFCCTCLENSKRLGVQAEEGCAVSWVLEKELKGLFGLAAAPGSRYRYFPKAIEGVGDHIYDSLDVNFFGLPDQGTGDSFYNHLDRIITAYILDPGVPDLIENEFRLFRQIRMVAMTYNLLEKELVYQKHKAGGESSWIMGRLDKLLTPVPVPKEEDRVWVICLETLAPGKNGEPAVRLPCGHIYGRTCLETWVNSRWAPGQPLSVCGLCRSHFDILAPWNRVAGVGGFQSEPPASLWWIPILQRASSN